MTLILTAVCPAFTVQVSDRLVTRRAATFDPLSNKVLIYCARNAIVTIGYSGLAFLDGKPTDEWIAERLWGERLLMNGRRSILCCRFTPNRTDLGRSLLGLHNRLQCLISKLPVRQRRFSLELTITGWQWAKRLARPIIAGITKQSGTDQVALYQLPRDWFRSKGLAVVEAGGWLEHLSGNKTTMLEQIADVVKQRSCDSDDVRRIMADTIRVVASRRVLSDHT